MKEFQFKYTIPKKQLFILLISIIIFILFEILGIFLKLSHLSYILGSFFIASLIFNKFKRKAIENCNAKLNDTQLTVEFENTVKTFYFADLTYYKAYYGRAGSTFSLKTNSDKLKLSINRNYCNSLDFDSFCKDAIEKINDYKQGVDIPQNQTVGGFPIL